jgi:hypothetical protein
MRPVTSLNAAAGKYAGSNGVARLGTTTNPKHRWIIPIAGARIAIATFQKKLDAVLFLATEKHSRSRACTSSSMVGLVQSTGTSPLQNREP